MTSLTLHSLFVQRLMKKTKNDFNKFTFPLKFTLKIYRSDLTIQEAKDDKQKLEILINKLNNNYNPKNKSKATKKMIP